MDGKTLAAVTAGFTVAQVAMVAAGHYVPAVKNWFAVGGMGLSLIAGLAFAVLAKGAWSAMLGGGAVAGGVSGLLGIGVSVALGDVPASLLLFGTLGSAVAGVAGGAAGKVLG